MIQCIIVEVANSHHLGNRCFVALSVSNINVALVFFSLVSCTCMYGFINVCSFSVVILDMEIQHDSIFELQEY